MELIVDNLQDKYTINKNIINSLENVIKLALIEEGVKYNVEISLTFVDNKKIRELNNSFRKIDKVTDVLSFPLYEKIEIENMKTKKTVGEIPLGDIVLSLEKANEQAIEYGHSSEREICFLICHSMFHLLGYDHDNDENTKLMRLKEEKILNELGITR